LHFFLSQANPATGALERAIDQGRRRRAKTINYSPEKNARPEMAHEERKGGFALYGWVGLI
jgi:hypothetical protein